MTANEPGLYIFEGHRYTMSRKWFVDVRDIVQVQRSPAWSRSNALDVVFMGCATKYPMECFEGKFTRVRIDDLLGESSGVDKRESNE